MVTAVVIGIFLLLVPRAGCYWQRLGGAVLPAMALVVIAVFVVAVVKLGASLGFAVENWSRHAFGAALPAIVYLLAIVGTLTIPVGIVCDALPSPVVERACYEGTVVSKTLRLRASGDFEWQSIGWFAMSEFHSGVWRWYGDTLRLTFSKEPPAEMAPTYVRKGDTLLGVAEGGGRSYPPYLLEGPCRGEN